MREIVRESGQRCGKAPALISVVIITKNEEHHLRRCLSSVSWADEILVIDANSTDQTTEICCDPESSWAGKLKLLCRSWSGFRDQRNYAIQQARFDWIFSIDADEECSPELALKIRTLLALDRPPAKAFKIRRIEFFLGKQIHYGVWNPSYQDRLFHREGVQYVNDIHEYPLFSSPPALLHEPILHSPDFSPEKFLDKMNRYTSIEARDRVAQGQTTHLFRLLGAFPAMFLKNYFYYGAYKDGTRGLIISLLEGLSRAVRHIKIWQYSQATNAGESRRSG